MILKGSVVTPRDNSYVVSTKCFHHYFGSQKSSSSIGEFIKVSVRGRLSDFSTIKSKIVKVLRKRKKVKSYIISTRYRVRKPDGAALTLSRNTSVLLKKRLTTRGKYTKGPFVYGLKRKKILGSFVAAI